jgi:hypothetical protein
VSQRGVGSISPCCACEGEISDSLTSMAAV